MQVCSVRPFCPLRRIRGRRSNSGRHIDSLLGNPEPAYPISHSTSDSAYYKVGMSKDGRLLVISFVPCSLFCCLP
jgi:hypothetical protein